MSMVVLINFFSAISSANRMANFSRSFFGWAQGPQRTAANQLLEAAFLCAFVCLWRTATWTESHFSYTFLLFSPFGAIVETKPVCYVAGVIGDTSARRWRCNNLFCWC